MYTAEFDAVVKDGKIEIPRQYQSAFFSNVKVFLTEIDPNNPESDKKNKASIMGKYKGYLSIKKFLTQKRADKSLEY
ncbi:hypothetical protein NO1_1617 [Candidatus Termititenax aidoneus]|uniref:Uncharacterized protein n=1 Tax=Termititenax aidoneus TaxID=2218524 RepID=A0A388TC72_TERA1|nr:hypothetical protein NO1_1617 [Candidatus Termititenax aidoneus]